MPDHAVPDAAIAAYAAEVRAFHAFFGAVLVVLMVLHLFVLLPYAQLQHAAPTVASALGEVTRRLADIDAEHQAIARSGTALTEFERALDAAPAELNRALSALVAQGRAGLGPAGGDPYAAVIRVRAEGPSAGGTGAEEAIVVEEAIRREIGRRTEALATAFDAALEPLRALQRPSPEVVDTIRTAEESLGRNLLALNEVLREAFAADPGFWQRLAGPTFAPASARAAEWTKGTGQALQAFEARLAAAGTMAESRREAEMARAGLLQARHQELSQRLSGFTARMAWLPLGLDAWVRLYPLIAGGLALTVLVRLRRLLALRRGLRGIDMDMVAPSWVVGASTAPGRWWALVLIALPVAATVHAALAAIGNPSLHTSVTGEPSEAHLYAFGATYAALIAACVWQGALAAWGIVSPPETSASPPTAYPSASTPAARSDL